MADVFVSYASENEAVVRAKLERLRARGVALWFAPDEHVIPGGAYYAESIAGAINGCKVLLLMATEHAFDSRNVLREVELAGSEDKPIVPLLLSPNLDVPEGFRYRLALEQHVTVDDQDAAWVDRLLNALRHHGVDIPGTHAPLAKARRSKKFSNGLLPYLADRDTQESILEVVIGDHLETSPHRPIAFVVHGEESECCDMFAERLARHTLPSHLERQLGSNQLAWKSVRWPEPSGETTEAVSRDQLYCRAVFAKLEQPPTDDPMKLMKHISALRRPVLFSSIIGSDAWGHDEPQFISGILRWWSQVPDVPVPSQPLVLILSVSFVARQGSLIDRLFRNAPRNPLCAQLSAIEPPGEQRLSLNILPELSSLTLSDIEYWVREIMQPDEIDDILRVVRAIFKRRSKEARHDLETLLELDANDPAFGLLSTVLQSRDRLGKIPMEPLAPLLKRLLRAENVLRTL